MLIPEQLKCLNEIAHNRAGETPDILRKDDLRRAFQLPDDVISAGLEANPR